MKRVKVGVASILAVILLSLLQSPSAHAALYSFTTHTFTSCGKTGWTGPSLDQCKTAYSAATWSANASNFDNWNFGEQLWTVPEAGLYRITAYGASGGIGFQNHAGGAGAKIQGDISLSEGAKLFIMVGQTGSNGGSASGGGGGGTFVSDYAKNPLIVAGGGGGGGANGAAGDMTGVDASLTTSGTPGRDGLIAGGANGNGGASSSGQFSGAGGGGFLVDGGAGIVSGAGGGTNFGSHGGGGISGSGGVSGGYGGGGASSLGAGGGGGYSGGGGDYALGSGTDREGGGGGGSFISGINQVTQAGANTGNGSVTITFLGSPPNAPTIGSATTISSTSASVSFTAPTNSGTGTITSYTAKSTPGSLTATVTQSGSGSITITGLSPNTSYRFKVIATSDYGNSLESSFSNSTVTSKLNSSISFSLPNGASTAVFRTPIRITATTVGSEGKVTFFFDSKRIGNCIKKQTVALSVTCDWKPTRRGGGEFLVQFTPSSTTYLASSSSRTILISGRLSNR